MLSSPKFVSMSSGLMELRIKESERNKLLFFFYFSARCCSNFCNFCGANEKDLRDAGDGFNSSNSLIGLSTAFTIAYD